MEAITKMIYPPVDVETEITEDEFYEIGKKKALEELAAIIEDEDADIQAELDGDATQRFNASLRR